MKHSSLSRRTFLQSMAAAGAAAPFVWTDRSTVAEDLNSQLTFAAIGVGGPGSFARGGKIARDAAKHARPVAVCEVDRNHANMFNDEFDNKLTVYKDYRKLLEKENIDFVTIGTPDHWHVPIAIAALRAGCDVYCEKPLTLTIDEGKQICKVVEETGRVFQVGTQQRSASRFLQAVAIAQSGRLGDNLKAYCGIGGAPAQGPFQPTTAPDYLDWDFWLGPAPKVPYTVERSHKTFRWWLEYSGGKMTDWGAHHIDIAQWALGLDKSGPTRIQGTGTFPDYIPKDIDPVAFFAGDVKLPNGYNAPSNFNIDLSFGDGQLINVQPKARGDNGNGILIEGDKGRIFVNRGRITGKPIEELTEADKEWLDGEVVKLYKGRQPGDHMQNFVECMKDGTQPISDVWTHHRTMTACHLCNITLLLGRELEWDPVKEEFIGDDQANRLLSRPARKGYETPA